jgi:hypothetical protein
MLDAGLVNRVATSFAVPLKPDQDVVPRCACGHPGCGDSQVAETFTDGLSFLAALKYLRHPGPRWQRGRSTANLNKTGVRLWTDAGWPSDY